MDGNNGDCRRLFPKGHCSKNSTRLLLWILTYTYMATHLCFYYRSRRVATTVIQEAKHAKNVSKQVAYVNFLFRVTFPWWSIAIWSLYIPNGLYVAWMMFESLCTRVTVVRSSPTRCKASFTSTGYTVELSLIELAYTERQREDK